MNSHELARVLLELPDLPVATVAMGHVYSSSGDARSHGELQVGTLEHYAGQCIAVGNIGRRMLNYPNWWISDVHLGAKVPDDYGWWENGREMREQAYSGPTLNGAIARRDRRKRMNEPIEVMLMGDGIDRYNTGDVEGICAQVDARGGPPEPQFGGKWAGSAYRSNEFQLLAETKRIYATPQEAVFALNELLAPHGRKVLFK